MPSHVSFANQQHYPMRRPWAYAAIATLVSLACGCGSDASHGSAEAPGEQPDDEMYHGSVQGLAVDDEGTPLAGLTVTLCSEVCLVEPTDDEGVFRFDGVRPSSHVLENLLYPGEDQAASAIEYTKFFDLLPVAEDERVILDRPYVVRRVPERFGPLSGMQNLTFESGLEVSFDADRFDPEVDLLTSGAEELDLGAVEIPREEWPAGGLSGWSILRVWGLLVWDLHDDDVFAVRAPLGDAGPLPEGTEVAFLVADYTYGFQHGVFFEEEAELSDDGTAIVTPADGGLDRATLWLAVAKPD